MLPGTEKRPRVHALLVHLAQVSAQADQHRTGGAERSHAEDLATGDADRDGVPDETEAWLGTSTHTDQTHTAGRDDAGFATEASDLRQTLEHDEMSHAGTRRFLPVGKVDPRYTVPAPPASALLGS